MELRWCWVRRRRRRADGCHRPKPLEGHLDSKRALHRRLYVRPVMPPWTTLASCTCMDLIIMDLDHTTRRREYVQYNQLTR